MAKITPEIETLLIKYVHELGSVAKAIKALPISLSEMAVSNYRKRPKNKVFSQNLDLARAAYQAGHPEQNLELIVGHDKLFQRAAKEGKIIITQRTDPKTNEIIYNEIKRIIEVDHKTRDVLIPKPTWAEEALMFYYSNHIQYLQNAGHLTDEERSLCIREAMTAKDQALLELQKQGTKLRYLDTPQ